MAIALTLGIFCGLALYAGGNADYRAQAGWGGFVYWIALGGGAGAVTGLAACMGAAVALVARDRDLRRESEARVAIGAVGASIGAVGPWIVVGVAVSFSTAPGWWLFPLGVAVMVAVGAAVVARVLFARAERAALRVGGRLEA